MTSSNVNLTKTVISCLAILTPFVDQKWTLYLPSITFLGHGPVVASNLLSPVMFPLTLLSHLGAAYTTVAISGERCIAITTPLKVTQWLTTRRVKVVTVLILVWSLAYNIPRILFFAPTAYWESSINSTWYRLEPTDFANYGKFLVIYFGYLNTIFKVLELYIQWCFRIPSSQSFILGFMLSLSM
ncbi:hypothetical protein RRG08_028628 [Elysia crispata]|uniref:G-protein coupled receptors family 1 profile domain-containing protein n=1 Tax=Elysia crispata TaxID=231223 RepID=A0AAE0ZSA2_9GAST|nr:hypothetical protein RRG08_028628 [Elysia crispata]